MDIAPDYLHYKEAVLRLSVLLGKTLNIFQASTVLAVLYDLPKEATLDDLIRTADRVRTTLKTLSN